MNEIRESLSRIRATEDLKKHTLEYLLKQQEKKSGFKQHPVFKYALAAICMLLLLGAGGYSVYRQPVSYISIDVNPSVELEINRFGRVVSTNAYNEDGQTVLQHLSLNNIPYVQAINELLAEESSSGFLKEDSLLVFTVISDQDASIMEELSAAEFSRKYATCLYTSDTGCMKEAHSYQMSFGKYRGYQELSQHDDSVTIEDCNNMTMEELHNRIENCSEHGSGHGSQHHGTSQTETPDPDQTDTPKPAGTQESDYTPEPACTPEPTDTGHHGKHHK
ncbi:MAG: hypothetical protein K2J60_02295 [Acetatifactor sp.]|nr:hypothetical protein [Acetatifactor sp.]